MPGYFDAGVRVSDESEIIKSPPRNYPDGNIDLRVYRYNLPSFETFGSALSGMNHLTVTFARKSHGRKTLLPRRFRATTTFDEMQRDLYYIDTLLRIETHRGIFFSPCYLSLIN